MLGKIMMTEVTLLAKALKENRGVDFAYLFGSRAAGRAGDASDWDIAVLFVKNPHRESAWCVFDLEAELSHGIGEETHIVPLNGLDSPVFQFQVVSKGLVLADNNPAARVSYEVGVLRRYHDWRYFLERHMGHSPRSRHA